MDTVSMPPELQISSESACALALECWRLRHVLARLEGTNEGLTIRRFHRQLFAVLEGMSIAILDFVGRPYDPGMAPEVVEVQEDPKLPESRAVVEETISPTVTWHGQVVRAGQITVRRSKSIVSEVNE